MTGRDRALVMTGGEAKSVDAIADSVAEILVCAGGPAAVSLLAALDDAGIVATAASEAMVAAAIAEQRVAAVVLTAAAFACIDLDRLVALLAGMGRGCEPLFLIEDAGEAEPSRRFARLDAVAKVIPVGAPCQPRLLVAILRTVVRTVEWHLEQVAGVSAALISSAETGARLRESEERNRCVIELSDLIVFTADVDGRATSVDDRFYTLTGVPRGEPLGLGASKERIHPDDRDHVLANQARARDTLGALNYEYRGLDAQGIYRWWQLRARPRLSAEGEVLGWDGTLRDVDARRRAEDKLRESEELHRFSLQLSEMVVWSATPDGNVTEVGDRLFEIAGVSREQMFGKKMRDWLHPDDADAMSATRRRSLAEGAPADFAFRMRKADSRYHWWRWRSAPLRDENGAIVRWYGTLENIDSLRRAEDRLRESEELHRYTIELSGQIPWTATPEAGVVLLDDAGVAPVQPGDLDRRILVHPDDLNRVEDERRHAFASGEPLDHVYRLARRDGHHLWFRARGAPRRGADGKVVRWYGTFENVDARTRAELQLKQLRSEMIHLSRLNAMGTMASTLAHELNQPLAAVINYINGSQRLLQSVEGGETEAVRAAMDSAERCAMRAGEIIRKLRQLVSRNTTIRALENVAELVDDACRIALINSGELGIQWQVAIDPAASEIYVDGIQVQQILINFLRNAVDAVADAERRTILISTERRGDMCELAVLDSGKGVAPSLEMSMFEPFQSSKPHGIGIGLTISRTIAEAHGGRIDYTTGPAGGARFSVRLPIAMADPPE